MKTLHRENRGRMGLLRDYRLAKPKGSPGVRNWCPCCVPAEFCRRKGKDASQRVIKRAVRAYGKGLIREAWRDINPIDSDD